MLSCIETLDVRDVVGDTLVSSGAVVNRRPLHNMMSRLRQKTHAYMYTRYVTLRYVTLRWVRTLRYVTIRHDTSRHVTLRYVTLRYVTFRFADSPRNDVLYRVC